MNAAIQGLLTLLGRLMLCAVFFLSAVGNKIPNFAATARSMAKEGVPSPAVLLVGAIGFLIVGSLSVVTGYRGRIGATLLLVFLVLATYYYHDFWTMRGSAAQEQMIQALKNLGLAGALVMIIANGTGPWSLTRTRKAKARRPT